jgi:hypothetical protein
MCNLCLQLFTPEGYAEYKLQRDEWKFEYQKKKKPRETKPGVSKVEMSQELKRQMNLNNNPKIRAHTERKKKKKEAK